jgi:hypothetical protein
MTINIFMYKLTLVYKNHIMNSDNEGGYGLCIL